MHAAELLRMCTLSRARRGLTGPTRSLLSAQADGVGIYRLVSICNVCKAPLFKQVAALSCLKEHHCSALQGF